MATNQRATVSVCLTQTDRNALNLTIERLDTTFARFVHKHLDAIASSADKRAVLDKRVALAKQVPKHMRGHFNTNGTGTVSIDTYDQLMLLATRHEVRIGAVVREAVRIALETPPEFVVSPEKLIAKMARMLTTIRSEPHRASAIAPAVVKWHDAGGQPSGWVKDVADLAAYAGIDPWSMMCAIHGAAVDQQREHMETDLD